VASTCIVLVAVVAGAVWISKSFGKNRGVSERSVSRAGVLCQSQDLVITVSRLSLVTSPRETCASIQEDFCTENKTCFCNEQCRGIFLAYFTCVNGGADLCSGEFCPGDVIADVSTSPTLIPTNSPSADMSSGPTFLDAFTDVSWRNCFFLCARRFPSISNAIIDTTGTNQSQHKFQCRSLHRHNRNLSLSQQHRYQLGAQFHTQQPIQLHHLRLFPLQCLHRVQRCYTRSHTLGNSVWSHNMKKQNLCALNLMRSVCSGKGVIRCYSWHTNRLALPRAFQSLRRSFLKTILTPENYWSTIDDLVSCPRVAVMCAWVICLQVSIAWCWTFR